MKSDSAGTISGGSSTNRSWPSTSWVSLASAARWSLDWALVTLRWTVSIELVAGLVTPSLGHHPGVEVGVPDVQVPHPGELAHGPAIGAGAPGHHRPAGGIVERPAAGGDLEAGRQALEVPLERAGEGLVEVVDVEDELALGRGEPPEVGQMGVAAQLHLEAGGRRGWPGRRPSPPPPPGRRRRPRRPSARSGWGPGREGGWWPGGTGSRAGRCGRPPGPTPRGSTGAPWPGPVARTPLALPGMPASPGHPPTGGRTAARRSTTPSGGGWTDLFSWSTLFRVLQERTTR